MAVAYKETMTKEELLEIAVSNGIGAGSGMTKKEILAALEEYNEQHPDEDEPNEDDPTEEPPVDENTEPENSGEYDLFVYVGPTLPRGRLKENAIFRGTLDDIKAYLADVLEEYPQIGQLIVPACRLGSFSVKVKTPGNLAHKYYTDIVSLMHGKKEV